MIVQLINEGVAVLIARSEHTKDNSRTSLPINYEGDISLLPSDVFTDDTWDADFLSTMFNRIAREHGLEITGDYIDMLPSHGSVDFTGYPPEPGYEEEGVEVDGEEKQAN